MLNRSFSQRGAVEIWAACGLSAGAAVFVNIYAINRREIPILLSNLLSFEKKLGKIWVRSFVKRKRVSFEASETAVDIEFSINMIINKTWIFWPHIGKIIVNEFPTYVAVNRQIAQVALQRLAAGKVKVKDKSTAAGGLKSLKTTVFRHQMSLQLSKNLHGKLLKS